MTTRRNIWVRVDSGSVQFAWTDEEAGVIEWDHSTHATFAAAKAQALLEATMERNEWAGCVRRIRQATLADVQGDRHGG